MSMCACVRAFVCVCDARVHWFAPSFIAWLVIGRTAAWLFLALNSVQSFSASLEISYIFALISPSDALFFIALPVTQSVVIIYVTIRHACVCTIQIAVATVSRMAYTAPLPMACRINVLQSMTLKSWRHCRIRI